MSYLSNLTSLHGSTHSKKRKGRGNGSGLGGTAGKGHKGQRARTGGKVRRGFEGGQTPLYRRLPKFGFHPITSNDFEVVNLSSLEAVGAEITPETLYKSGLVSKKAKIKILARGQITKAVQVRVHAFSEAAKAAIEKSGGKIEVIK